MTCSECEQLFDAYLDGQLAGSLRLEFDAHRLRCRHCQQTLAMLETIGNVIATDRQIPELSFDFSDRVLRRIKRPRRMFRPSLRVAVVIGAALQAAAVLLFAIMLNTQPEQDATPNVSAVVNEPALARLEDDPGGEALRELIVRRLEDRIWEAHAAGINLAADFADMRGYANIMLPEDVARDSVKMAGLNPLQSIFDALVAPQADEESEPVAVPSADDIHSI
ncbi:MAG: hypothetical protein KAY37_13645 [Phycisphaerae bacterium]|nr:hypothetical protein [Phycisphaerae bacterium]